MTTLSVIICTGIYRLNSFFCRQRRLGVHHITLSSRLRDIRENLQKTRRASAFFCLNTIQVINNVSYAQPSCSIQYYKNFNGPEGEVKELNSAFPSIEMTFKMSYRTLCIMCDGTFITKIATGSYNQPFYKSISNEMGATTSILTYAAVFAPGYKLPVLLHDVSYCG